jgi:putative glycosyltransferase (TIGR04372 family)
VRSIEAVIAVQRQWELEGRPPLLSLTAEDRRRGWDLLESLGVEREAWFACLHVREPGWLGETEQSEHRHSNADVDTYLAAVRLVTERRGWVIRMGDRSMKPLPPMERVLDYAHEPGRTDWMDVFLAAECRFFLGSTSGLFGLPYLFGRPSALANWCPMSDRPWSSRDLFIPKIHRPLGGGAPLPFAVGFAPALRHAAHISELISAGVEVVDSQPDEIVDLVREALDRDGDPDFYDERDLELRRRYDSLATFFESGVTSRPGRDFLRKYEELLPQEP